jgi:hypothetical protein
MHKFGVSAKTVERADKPTTEAELMVRWAIEEMAKYELQAAFESRLLQILEWHWKRGESAPPLSEKMIYFNLLTAMEQYQPRYGVNPTPLENIKQELVERLEQLQREGKSDPPLFGKMIDFNFLSAALEPLELPKGCGRSFGDKVIKLLEELEPSVPPLEPFPLPGDRTRLEDLKRELVELRERSISRGRAPHSPSEPSKQLEQPSIPQPAVPKPSQWRGS